MDTAKNESEEIVKTNMLIAEEFPELTTYINEMPVTIPGWKLYGLFSGLKLAICDRKSNSPGPCATQPESYRVTIPVFFLWITIERTTGTPQGNKMLFIWITS